LENTPAAVRADNNVPATVGPRWKQRFAQLARVTPGTTRTLYFSGNNPLPELDITELGAAPAFFDPNNPPALVTTQGSVENWTIQSQALENHEFHIHQILFLVLAQDNFEINSSQPDPGIQGQLLDSIQVLFWDENPGHPFPSVTVRMDFHGATLATSSITATSHQDGGMMAIIRVEPPAAYAAIEESASISLRLANRMDCSLCRTLRQPKRFMPGARAARRMSPHARANLYIDNRSVAQR